jgi:hypothetical protein
MGIVLGMLALFRVGGLSASQQPSEPAFQYAGGTEKIEQGCAGKVEVTNGGLVFRCPLGSIDAPFSAITLMQYRPDLSKPVRNLKIKWQVRPDPGGGKRNKYFTVVYNIQGKPHVVVLRVPPKAMRPYLAEIELKSGKRVEVMGYENYRD